MYRLDKTAVKVQSKEQAANTVAYWRAQSPEERWRAAWLLTCQAYGIDPDHPPRLDKTLFSIRKHE